MKIKVMLQGHCMVNNCPNKICVCVICGVYYVNSVVSKFNVSRQFVTIALNSVVLISQFSACQNVYVLRYDLMTRNTTLTTDMR